MSDELATPTDYTSAVQDNLLKVQQEADKRELCHTDPERWAKGAVMLMNGCPILELRQKLGGSHYTWLKVEAQMDEQLADIAKKKAREVRVMTNMNDQVSIKHYEKLMEKLEAGEELTDEQARIAKNFADAGTKLSHRVDRLEGRADQIVEVREAKTPDQLMKEFEEKFMANTIEAEVIEG